MNMGLIGMGDVSASLDFHTFNNASAKFQMLVLQNTSRKILA